ncbi:MAG: hypothetical protein SGJ20_05965, partial [Planctomycetota bacterium]|nr:hypothetical protein [Planctomycetota bacterium]
MLEQEDPLVRKFLSVGVLTIVMLVALRVSIGWHFFSQGLEHYHDRNWSSEGFLRQAKGPFADFYQSQIPDFHGWNELVSLPWEESAAEAASVRPDAKASKDKKKEKNDKAAPDKSKKPNTARATPAGRAHLQSLLNPQLAFLQETVESEPKSSEEPKSTEEPASTDEPKSTEEPKSESPAKTDSTTSEPAKTEEAKSDTVTPEPANSEPAKSEPAKS